MKSKLAILYLSIGSGHQVAAECLADAIKREQPETSIIVEDPFAGKLEILPSVLNILQSASIVFASDLYDVVWRRGTPYNIYDWITGISLLRNFLWEKLLTYDVDTVVCTHVLPCRLAAGIKKHSATLNVYGVITDFGVHCFWPIENVDGYFVGHDEIKNILVYRGYDESRIYITGIPIRPVFEMGGSSTFGLSNTLRVLVMAGGIRSSGYVGSKNYVLELLKELQRENIADIHITIVTGNRRRLQKEIQRWANDHWPNSRVLGFVQRIENLMFTHDIIITKPGGLIIAEALACGLCMIMCKPGPGQESANADFLARHGLALNGAKPTDAVKILKRLSRNPEVIREIQQRAKSVGIPDSAKRAAVILKDIVNR